MNQLVNRQKKVVTAAISDDLLFAVLSLDSV